ncbi:MAG: Gfo/Idh/MocA family oxidoreductase [Planctomycetota bacterium]|nr:Gfo/Idh/MocA family oxidoreductase [Planctomycetota bacterium]
MKRIGRRRFLKQSARGAAGVVAGAAALGAAPLAFPEAPGAGERVRIAVLGVRGRGRNHAEGFAALKDVEVVAVCDPDRGVLGRAAAGVEKAQGKAPRQLQDFRPLLEDKSIDAISIATPDHWHALATIWSCQAGKDVYVEKPCSHTIREGRLMVEAARKYERVVQHGTQSRSGETFFSALEFLRSKPLGEIRVAKVINSQRRANIGHKKDGPVPDGVDYDLWLGPASKRPFNANRFHYNWNWHWDYGTGDIGNDGVHAIDYCRWFLGVEDPVAVSASGAKLHFDDDQETPDTQTVTFEFRDCHMIYEMRIWTPYGEHGMGNGTVLYGENGYMEISPQGWRVFYRGNEPGPTGPGKERAQAHFQNFVDCVRSRKTPNAEIREGHLSSRLSHLGNIATRVGRRLRFDAATETFVDDREADALLGKEYRQPFVVPDPV